MLRSSTRVTLLVILISVGLGSGLCTGVAAQTPNKERINLNTASPEELVKELMDLPGIGRVIAERIVEHRQKHGPFKRPQDVIIVRGMHAKLYRSIERFICV